jgi:hypothetical protein
MDPAQVDKFLILFPRTIPAYILPVIIGSILLARSKTNQLSRLAGVFTLKPLVATPIWLFIYLYTHLEGLPVVIEVFFLLLIAVGLTGLIVLVFKPLLKTETKMVSVLLVMDSLRWLNTALYLIFMGALTYWFISMSLE